jgi:hypothetical protein
LCVIPGRGCAGGVVGVSLIVLPDGRRVRNYRCRRRACERPGVEGKTPVAEMSVTRLGATQVAQGPRNPV